MKAIEQYFPVVLFIMLYKVVLTFESVDEILKCNHLNESSTFTWYKVVLASNDRHYFLFVKYYSLVFFRGACSLFCF